MVPVKGVFQIATSVVHSILVKIPITQKKIKSKNLKQATPHKTKNKYHNKVESINAKRPNNY